MSDVLGTIAQGVNPLTTMGNVVNIQRGMQDLQTQRFNLQQAKLQPAYAGLMALRLQTKANGGPGVSWGGIMSSLADSQRLGADISGMTADINDAAARGENPDDIVRGMSIRGMPAFEQFGAVTPETTLQNIGGQLVPFTVGARGGPSPGALNVAGGGLTGVQLGLSPAELNQPLTIPDPSGVGPPITMSTGEAIRRGLWSPPGGFGGGGFGGGAPSGGVSAPQQQGAPAVTTPPAASKQAFVQSFGPTAQRIAQATGLPVNYVLAQAGLETGWGTSPAYQRNNFFGISAPGQPGVPGGYASPDAGADAYIGLVNSRYANVPRTGSLQEIGDAMARAGYNPQVPGAPGGPSYGTRIQSFAQGLPAPGSYQVASTAPVAPPPAPAPAGAPGTAAAGPAPYYGQGGGVIVGTTPGAPEMVSSAVGRVKDLNAAASQVQATRSILEGMENDLRTPGAFTGVGAGFVSQLRQLAINMNMLPTDYQLEAGQSAQEHFNKLTAQLESQTMQMLGAPSDARQEMAAASNPSALNSREGNLNIVHMLEGNLQAINVMQRAFLNSGQPPGAFDRWRANFTAADPATHGMFDPRTFWLANMNPQEQYDYLNNIKNTNPKALTRVTNNLKYAVSQGWIYKAPDNSIGSDW